MKTKEWIGFCLCLAALAGWASAQDRGVGVGSRQIGADAAVGKQWLVLVAINRYQEWDALQGPVRDAEELRKVLQDRYCIDQTVQLYDEAATRAGILKLFLRLQEELAPEDSVLIFYAGHGHLDKSSNTGFWIPVDGSRDLLLQTNWLPNTQIRGLIANIKARHVCLVSDSCFSGDILDKNRGAAPQIDDEYWRTAYSRRSRQVLTSGESEQVPDSSPFARQLKLALAENRKPCLDPLMLYNEIRLGVNGTMPMLGNLQGTDHQEGASFLLFLKEAGSTRTAGALASSAPSREQESLARIKGMSYSSSAPAPRQPSREEIAREAYEAAGKVNTEEAWREVMANFSGTRWGELAKDKLFELEQGRKALAAEGERRAREDEEAVLREKRASVENVWAQTQQADTLEAYNDFVARYHLAPEARQLVSKAQLRMAQLRGALGGDGTSGRATNPDGESTGTKTVPRSVSPGGADRYTMFVDRLLSLTSPEDTAQLMAFYGPTVDFFSRKGISPEEIGKERTRFMKAWPIVRYQRQGPVQAFSGSDGAVNLEYDLAYMVESPTRRERATGTVHCFAVVRQFGNDLKIVSYQERSLSRNKEQW